MPRILVIDDDRDLTEMLAEYLRPEGFTVEEGLQRALATDYALIVCIIQVPQNIYRNLWFIAVIGGYPSRPE